MQVGGGHGFHCCRRDFLVVHDLRAHSHRIGSDIELSEVVAIVDQNARVTVLRKLPLKKTDVDVPEVTDWTTRKILLDQWCQGAGVQQARPHVCGAYSQKTIQYLR